MEEVGRFGLLLLEFWLRKADCLPGVSGSEVVSRLVTRCGFGENVGLWF